MSVLYEVDPCHGRNISAAKLDAAMFSRSCSSGRRLGFSLLQGQGFARSCAFTMPNKDTFLGGWPWLLRFGALEQQIDVRRLLPVRALLKWFAICVIIAVPIGTASALFLTVLGRVTEAFGAYPWLLWLLPLLGAGSAFVYQKYGGRARFGMTLILDEASNPEKPIPLRMAFLSAGGTLLSLLGGGSVGIEATGVQMACGLADSLGMKLGVSRTERPILLTSAIAAGFGSIFGTPVAGTLFAIEVMRLGAPVYGALLPALFCSVLAERVTTQLWGVPRHPYVHTSLPPIETSLWLKVVLASVALGLIARLFVFAVRRVRSVANRYIEQPVARPLIGGALIVLLTLAAGTTIYNGLGTETLDLALQGKEFSLVAPLLKILFTAVTIGFGFIGGEVTPLFFVGATAGSALAAILGLPTDMMAKLGFVALLAGGTHAPLTGVMIGMELFGGGTPVYPATACILAYVFSGPRGIYAPSRAESQERAPLSFLLESVRRTASQPGQSSLGPDQDLHAGTH